MHKIRGESSKQKEANILPISFIGNMEIKHLKMIGNYMAGMVAYSITLATRNAEAEGCVPQKVKGGWQYKLSWKAHAHKATPHIQLFVEILFPDNSRLRQGDH